MRSFLLYLRCKRNCRRKVSGSDKHSLAGSCEEESREKPVKYAWDLKILEEKQSTHKSWKAVDDLRNLTATDVKMKYIVLKPNSLIGGRYYQLTLTGLMYGRTPARAITEFLVNKPPYGGQCTVDIASGYAENTNFTFDCWGWKDDDTPLSYEHNYRNMYGLATLIYYGTKNTVKTKLPVGNPKKNFTTTFFVRVLDSYGAYEQFNLPVQVCYSELLYFVWFIV